MPSFKTTRHFDKEARFDHEEANRSDWIELVLAQPAEAGPDPTFPDRTLHYGYIAEADKYMRVVVMSDGAVHTAFFDRNYTKRARRESAKE